MQNNSSKFKISFKFFLVVFSFSFFIFSLASEANAASASLFLSPPSGTYTVGSSFLVSIKLNSGGEAINAAEGTLIFNPSEISVVALSKSNSIFSLWTTEPIFSNSEGNIVFGGGTPTPFSGSSGTIISITFKAKASASAQVNFSSGSVLKADGKGTNILANMNGGVYTFEPKVITPPAEEVPPEAEFPPLTPGAPAAPVVSSDTHPDPNQWHSNNDPVFFWKVPIDVTAVKLLIGHLPTAAPTVLYSPAISEKKLDDLADGVWYFHVRFKNQYGWGGILHRKVLIDTEPSAPFEIIVDDEGDLTNPRPILHFYTTDSLSGVEYYEVKIGEGEAVPITAVAIKTNPYRMPPQAPGKHTIIVKAVDAAGNSTVATTNIFIEPLEKPVITDFPQTIKVGDVLTIKGTSLYPDAAVTVFVKKEGEEVSEKDVKTDSQGNWIFLYDKSLEKGVYQVWAEITDSRGAKSNPTEKIIIAAALPPFLQFGKVAIDYLTLVITLAALVIVLILFIIYARYRIFLYQKRIRKETEEVEESVKQAFKILREEIQKQIEYLDKKPGLTKEEKQIRDKLQKVLKVSERAIRKEIKDIKQELK